MAMVCALRGCPAYLPVDGDSMVILISDSFSRKSGEILSPGKRPYQQHAVNGTLLVAVELTEIHRSVVGIDYFLQERIIVAIRLPSCAVRCVVPATIPPGDGTGSIEPAIGSIGGGSSRGSRRDAPPPFLLLRPVPPHTCRRPRRHENVGIQSRKNPEIRCRKLQVSHPLSMASHPAWVRLSAAFRSRLHVSQSRFWHPLPGWTSPRQWRRRAGSGSTPAMV